MPTLPTPQLPESDLQLEIAHLLLIDIVGYSKLLVNEQIESVQELGRIVRSTECFRNAEEKGKLIRVPTGDGMALLFFQSPEEPVRCALEISQQLKENAAIRVRMGIHSGPVNQVRDVNDTINVAGTGINVAQRVMDCGDAGHILLSKHVADDLTQYRHWQPYLHDFGECEVKHGMRLQIFNLYKDGVGNPALPQKFRRGKRWKQIVAVRPVSLSHWPRPALIGALCLSVLAVAVSSVIFLRRSAPGTSVSAVNAAIPEKSIAVLPFANLSDDKQNAYFTNGVQDEILNDLSKVADLKVISRTSVMQYNGVENRNLREIAKLLGVAHLVEGTVQRVGERVRVSAQLIDARTDMHIWGEHYDRDLADVFALESEVAEKIVDRLKATLSPEEKSAINKRPTSDLKAFELYERAKALWGDVSDVTRAGERLPEAAQLLDEAVLRDPEFLEAWCLLSRTHGAIYRLQDHTQSRLDQAKAAVQRALDLQPTASEAHLALAIYYYFGFLDYRLAREELAIAKRTLPNDAEVFLYAGLMGRREGRWDEATRNFERAMELDPMNLFLLQQFELGCVAQRRYPEAKKILDRILSIVPGDPVNRVRRALVEFHSKADIKPYRAVLAELLAENQNMASRLDSPQFALCERSPEAATRALANYPREGVTAWGINFPHGYWEGVFARAQGDLDKARVAFTSARRQVEMATKGQAEIPDAVSLLGKIDAGLGRKREALNEGRRACELMPISKDAVHGQELAVDLAQIYAWTGDKDLAIEQIAAIERSPNELSYGLLKLHPDWDSLRGDPRFEKILADLAPK